MKKFENEIVDIIYDEELRILSLVYKEKPKGDHFIAVNQKFIEVFKTLDCNKILINAIVIKVVGVENQNWVAHTMIPELLKHIKGKTLFHAQILNSDAFVQFAARNIEKKSMSGNDSIPMLINAFESVEEGVSWLQAKN